MNNMNEVLFISHGGGPLPILGDPGHKEMVDNLNLLSKKIKRPDVIIVISAHWEEDIPVITGADNPELIYDYYGFPPESYDIKYPASGDPELAKEIYEIFKSEGIISRIDNNRGLDHGSFIPLKIMYPEADIPTLQISLKHNLNPEQHIKIGEALSKLNRENVLFLGSGFTFHNLGEFFNDSSKENINLNNSFQNWVEQTLSDDSITNEDKDSALINWSNAPGARYCHPREEHLLPLHVCYGIKKGVPKEIYEVNILNKKSLTVRW